MKNFVAPLYYRNYLYKFEEKPPVQCCYSSELLNRTVCLIDPDEGFTQLDEKCSSLCLVVRY